MKSSDKIVITGAAGLVGQNLIPLLRERDFTNLIAIDKHPYNVKILRQLHPDLAVVEADLAERGAWEDAFRGAAIVIQLHAQITGKTSAPFVRNNLRATEHVLAAMRQHAIPYLVHVSSSVVNSVADDDYTNTKKQQEQLVRESGIRHCILRPTLMFGWFDPKHLGWLARFMEKTPVFPIPGHGRYLRQPLYNRDFCRAIIACAERQPDGAAYDLVGPDEINYIDMIRAIKRVKELRTVILRIPYGLFYVLLRIYALFSEHPPFTADQLKALTAGDHFTGVDMEATFGVKPTRFEDAVKETFSHPVYSSITLEQTA